MKFICFVLVLSLTLVISNLVLAAPGHVSRGPLSQNYHKALNNLSFRNLVPYFRSKIHEGRLPHFLMEELSEDFVDADGGNDFQGPNKRQFDEYGHLRFGKRDDFDDYGHLRFGRSSESAKH